MSALFLLDINELISTSIWDFFTIFSYLVEFGFTEAASHSPQHELQILKCSVFVSLRTDLYLSEIIKSWDNSWIQTAPWLVYKWERSIAVIKSKSLRSLWAQQKTCCFFCYVSAIILKLDKTICFRLIHSFVQDFSKKYETNKRWFFLAVKFSSRLFRDVLNSPWQRWTTAGGISLR